MGWACNIHETDDKYIIIIVGKPMVVDTSET
jgi:hypothetical protein